MGASRCRFEGDGQRIPPYFFLFGFFAFHLQFPEIFALPPCHPYHIQIHFLFSCCPMTLLQESQPFNAGQFRDTPRNNFRALNMLETKKFRC